MLLLGLGGHSDDGIVVGVLHVEGEGEGHSPRLEVDRTLRGDIAPSPPADTLRVVLVDPRIAK